jgi:hypothetical protein
MSRDWTTDWRIARSARSTLRALEAPSLSSLVSSAGQVGCGSCYRSMIDGHLDGLRRSGKVGVSGAVTRLKVDQACNSLIAKVGGNLSSWTFIVLR